MKIFRLFLLALATALFAINFWAIDYNNLVAKESLWAYFRIVVAVVLIVLIVKTIRNAGKKIPVKPRTGRDAKK